MSPAAVAPVEAPPAPPERPGYVAVAVAAFLGYLIAGVLALVVVLVVNSAGIGLIHQPGSGRGLFYRYDAWSWAAEACAAVLIVTVTSLLVGAYLRARTGWEAGFGTIFATLFLAGYAPGLGLTLLYGATGVVSLLVATFVLRRAARPSGAEPRSALGQVPSRFRRPVAIAVAVLFPAMAIYVLFYAATHPLRHGSGNAMAFDRNPGGLERFPLNLFNDGGATVTDLSIVKLEGSPALQFVRAGVPVRSFSWDGPREPLPHEWPMRPLSGAELGSQADSYIEIELRQGRACPLGRAELDAVWVRYTVHGMRHEQRIPVDGGPFVRCR
jgi:hypothetical protein